MLYMKYEKDSSDPEIINDDHMKELESQTNYQIKITTRLKELNMPDHKQISACKMDVKLPNLQCAFFSGESHTATEYSAFIAQFNNVVGWRANLSDSVKLTYLGSYLRGYAFKVISHLTIEENYPVALALLEREFLNRDLIIEELFNKLTALKPKSETYVDLKVYLSEVRCVLSDLKLQDIDLLKDFSSAKFVSHLIFNKLPLDFKQELVRKLDNGYPSFAQIEDNYVEVIRTLELKTKPRVKDVHIVKPEVRAKTNFSTFNVNADNPMVKSDVFEKACKFCNVKGHSMYKCKKFCTYNSRVNRCKELNLCSSCSSSRHLAEACPGKLKFECNNCKSNSHIAALCNKTTSNVNICLNSYAGSNNDYLLPTLTITIYYGLKTTKVRCLLDTGSQRSYVSSRALNRVNYPACHNAQEFMISTFLEKSSRKFSEVSLAVNLGDSNRTYQLPFLLDNNLQLSLSVAGLPAAIANIRSKHSLADCSFDNCSSDEIELEGLLGIDALQSFKFQSTKVLNGSAWQVAHAVVPYGAIDSFLTNDQLTRKYEQSKLSSDDSAVFQSVVSCALQPKGSYFDPVAALYPESQVESNLDNFFSIESIGIPAKEKSDDDQMMKEFEKGISFENGKYHVGLPWIKDKINNVPSNFSYAKAILARVVENLTKRDLLSDYNAIFEEQLAEGVIEEIDLTQIDTSQNNWLPHRPVIKTSPQVTTKIRPVLNCSFKVNDSVSLNDAAYKGINLVNNLLDLLVKIRANQYLVVSDIKKAFLQIKLSSAVDKDKFSILWIHPDGSLRAFRYCTIVFGYVASPFILQCVMRHHLQSLPPSDCRNMLLSNFYVDNLFYSGDNIEILDKFYREACELMEAGGFTLRSWFSNNVNLQESFQVDCRNSDHGSGEEKILGYRYIVANDTLHVSSAADPELSQVDSKRGFLAYFARLFDPLGLTLPLLVTGKIILRDMWLSKLDWDEPLPTDFKIRCDKFLKDSSFINDFKFSRQSYSEGEDVTLNVFCDASKEAYGTAIYATSDKSSKSNLLFAKVKTSPLQKKSIPTLELLSVFLAFKCIHTILSSLTCKVASINMAVDAQIVLSWLLTGNIKAKNQFAKNRLKDIYELKSELANIFGVTVNFTHIATDLNVSDLLTKGLTYNAFKTKFDLWKTGPEFLVKPVTEWPQSTLGCIPDRVKCNLACAVVSSSSDSSSSLFPVTKFSSLSKLLKVTSLVIKFTKLLRKKPFDNVSLIGEASRY